MLLADRILAQLAKRPGMTDRELTDALFSRHKHPSQVNQECRLLAQRGQLIRKDDGTVLRNYLAGTVVQPDRAPQPSNTTGDAPLSEDDVKRHIKAWLESDGWDVEVKWGRQPGIDILAQRGPERWVIEAKGSGSLPAMRVNYFLSMLGETLQRMTDPHAGYSIALPDMNQYRGLWERLPTLAKSRTAISMLFVDKSGRVSHLKD